MLCRKFKNIILTKPANSNAIYRPLDQTRPYSKWFEILSRSNMASTNRLKMFRDLFLTRILNAWTRSYMVNSVFRKRMAEKGMSRMFLYFRQVLFRPRTQLLVSATATIKNTEEKPGPPKKCNRNIKDKYMKKLIKDLDRVEDLARDTLYCPGCDKRLVLTDKQKGIQYCECPNTGAPKGTYDGWVPYMEAENIIIWRKEYKPGGLYAYKVYGRYKHVKAEDFANIQVDGAYRTVWDSAVANLSIVEKEANGMKDQMVLHWEVLWPRLFANRDYVYLRRHKEFNVRSRCYVHKDGIFPDKERCVPDINFVEGSNKCAHDKAKQKSLEMDKAEADAQTAAVGGKENTVYVIVSRSCVHPEVPHSKHAVRVMEYWSHMVITTLDGPDKPGMEFVLTYYDEPAVGGLPTAVTSWAMGRAGPVFLERMRLAAQQYKAWREQHTAPPDFSPFAPEPSQVSFDHDIDEDDEEIAEKDVESTNQGADLEQELPCDAATSDNSTQTLPVIITPIQDSPTDGPKVFAEATANTIYSKDPYFDPTKSVNQDDVPLKDVEEINKAMPVMNLNIDVEEDSLEVVQNLQTPMSETSPTDKMADNKNSIQKITTTVVIKPIDNVVESERDGDNDGGEKERDDHMEVSEEENKKASYWRYLYPWYYFGWQ